MLEIKAKRKKLIASYLANSATFWKEITNNRGARIEVDIDLEQLRNTYEDNFNKLQQSGDSLNEK